MSGLRRVVRSTASLRTYLHALRLAHFYSYSHVQQVAKIRRGDGVSFAPNVSFRNGERIVIGAGSHIGEHCIVWAGDSIGRIEFGEKSLLGPRCMLTASNYRIDAGIPVMDQIKDESDIIVGAGVWLGAGVQVTAGVRIGDGAVVGAGAVVTKNLPANCIAVGVPAKVIGYRPGTQVKSA